MQQSFQKRHNYGYREVELALKHSNDWGYHLELEIVVSDPKRIPEAERKIKTVAEDLNVEVISDEELAKFTQQKDQEHRDRRKR